MKFTFSILKGNVLIMTLARVLWWFSSRTFFNYFELFVLAMGGTVEILGLVSALGWVARLFFYPVGGYLADYRGRIRLISFARCLYGLVGLFYVFAQDWTMLAAGTFLQGLIQFYFPAMEALKADSIPPRQRATGFATIMGIPAIFAIFAPYVGGYLITLLGITIAMRYLIAVNVFSNIFAAVIYLKFLKDPLKKTESSFSLRDFPSLLKNSYMSLLKAIKLMSRDLRSLAVIAIFIAFFSSICGPFWVVYSVNVIGITPLQWGLIMLVMSGLSALRMPVGMLIDRYGKKRAIVAALALLLPSSLFFVYCKTFLHTLVLFILIGTANILLLPAGAALIADLVPKGSRGRTMAVMGEHLFLVVTGAKGPPKGFILDVFTMLGSLIGGYIYSFNPLYPWLLLSSVLVLCLFLSIILIHEPKELQL